MGPATCGRCLGQEAELATFKGLHDVIKALWNIRESGEQSCSWCICQDSSSGHGNDHVGPCTRYPTQLDKLRACQEVMRRLLGHGRVAAEAVHGAARNMGGPGMTRQGS